MSDYVLDEQDSAGPVSSTAGRTIQPGEPLGAGAEGQYRRLAFVAGEPHLRRTDLAEHAQVDVTPRKLLTFAHFTDIHVQDSQSPGRFEFIDRYFGPAALHLLVPSYRPQEYLQAYSVEAMIRTFNRMCLTRGGGKNVDFMICTGDLTDNAQHNELAWAVTLLQGGPVRPNSGGAAYEGVASSSWGDGAYWLCDEAKDEYKTRWGFPAYPGLLDSAIAGFDAEGIERPWIACFGNHDALIQGTALFTPSFRRMVTGDQKVTGLPEGFDLLGHLSEYIDAPEVYMSGPSHPVTPDFDRRNFDRRDFVNALRTAGGLPAGHGYGRAERFDGKTYYVDDSREGMRLIVLDTVNIGGNYHGSVGAAQYAWLEERLAEVHSLSYDQSGGRQWSTLGNRLVVIVSHHGRDWLINERTTQYGEQDLPRVQGSAVEELLHRFPNVILWVNGHTHHNTIAARPDPGRNTGGFWEVTTSSLADWPCQGRLVEIVSNSDGTLSIWCTMVDHAAPADPCSADGIWRLASVHRELAANDPHSGVAGGNSGSHLDRNVELVLPAPFDVDWL